MAPAPRLAIVLAAVLGLSASACGADDAPPSAPCEQQCQDGNALRALRETLKLAYNLTLQGNDVGAQDESTPCPLGGSAHIFGQASSDPMQGATFVELVYELDQCAYSEIDETPNENYRMTLTGVLNQNGTLAVQPSATTALIMTSDAMTFSGTVYDPPIGYEQASCALLLGQSGSLLAGTICGREAGTDL